MRKEQREKNNKAKIEAEQKGKRPKRENKEVKIKVGKKHMTKMWAPP